MSLLSSWIEKHSSSSLLEECMQACELALRNNFRKDNATVRVNVQFICKHDQTVAASKSGTHSSLRSTLLGVLLSTFVNQVWSCGNKEVNGFLWTPFDGNEIKFTKYRYQNGYHQSRQQNSLYIWRTMIMSSFWAPSLNEQERDTKGRYNRKRTQISQNVSMKQIKAEGLPLPLETIIGN